MKLDIGPYIQSRNLRKQVFYYVTSLSFIDGCGPITGEIHTYLHKNKLRQCVIVCVQKVLK